MSERLRTAIHEAGHVIAAMELGVYFGDVSIESDGETAGRVGVEGDDCFNVPSGTDPFSEENNRLFAQWADQQATIDYAGHAAVVAILGAGRMSLRDAVRSGAGPDFSKASRRLGADRRRMAALKARAIEIVTRRREEVQRVADELLRRGTVGAQEIDFIASGDREFLDFWFKRDANAAA